MSLNKANKCNRVRFSDDATQVLMVDDTNTQDDMCSVDLQWGAQNEQGGCGEMYGGHNGGMGSIDSAMAVVCCRENNCLSRVTRVPVKACILVLMTLFIAVFLLVTGILMRVMKNARR